jgi:hypothetical protein
VPTRQEIANNCRLANAMSEAKAVFVLDGDTADLSDVENWVLTPATVLSTTPKHVISPAIHLRSASQWVGTAEAASQSGDLTREPLLTLEVSPTGRSSWMRIRRRSNSWPPARESLFSCCRSRWRA